MRASYAPPGLLPPIQIWPLADGRGLHQSGSSRGLPGHGRKPGHCGQSASWRRVAHGSDAFEGDSARCGDRRNTAPRCRRKSAIPLLRNLRHQVFGKGNGNNALGISRVLLEAFNVTQDRMARAPAGDPRTSSCTSAHGMVCSIFTRRRWRSPKATRPRCDNSMRSNSPPTLLQLIAGKAQYLEVGAGRQSLPPAMPQLIPIPVEVNSFSMAVSCHNVGAFPLPLGRGWHVAPGEGLWF